MVPRSPNTNIPMEELLEDQWETIFDVYRSLGLDAPKGMVNLAMQVREEARTKVNPELEVRPQGTGLCRENKVVFTKRLEGQNGPAYLHVEIYPTSYSGGRSAMECAEEFDRKIRELFRRV